MNMLEIAKQDTMEKAAAACRALDAAAADIARFEEFCAVLRDHDLNIHAFALPIHYGTGANAVSFNIFLAPYDAHREPELLRAIVAMGCSHTLYVRGTDGSLTYRVTGDTDAPSFTLRVFHSRCAA